MSLLLDDSFQMLHLPYLHMLYYMLLVNTVNHYILHYIHIHCLLYVHFLDMKLMSNVHIMLYYHLVHMKNQHHLHVFRHLQQCTNHQKNDWFCVVSARSQVFHQPCILHCLEKLHHHHLHRMLLYILLYF